MFINDESFICERCGSCCKAVRCRLLVNNNICSIYSVRPELCNVNKSYQRVKNQMSQKRWNWINKECCKSLQALIKREI